MDLFVRTIVGVLISTVLYLALPKQAKELSVVLTIAVCCMVGIVAFSFLRPVFDFVDQLSATGNLSSPMIKTLIKAVGICLISEFASAICSDSGNAAMSKLIQFATTALLLSLTIPFLTQLIDIVENLLNEM